MGRERSFVELEIHRTNVLSMSGGPYALPPSRGTLPIHNVEDYLDQQLPLAWKKSGKRLPSSWRARGGVFIPMFEDEAFYIKFRNAGNRGHAIKCAAGKINVISGKPWNDRLQAEQDYVIVLPHGKKSQPYLDGHKCGDLYIRQFMATKRVDMHSVEGELTGKEDHGGLQLMVVQSREDIAIPPFGNPYHRHGGVGRWRGQQGGDPWGRGEWRGSGEEGQQGGSSNTDSSSMVVDYDDTSSIMSEMCLGAGGKMNQTIVPDPEGINAWDQSKNIKVWIHLIDPKDFWELTNIKMNKIPPQMSDHNGYEYGRGSINMCLHGHIGSGCPHCSSGWWGCKVTSSIALVDLKPMTPIETRLEKDIRMCLNRGKCTFDVSNFRYVKQKAYRCLTCIQMGSNSTICESCKNACHKDHTVIPEKDRLSYCDCGASRLVKSCEFDPSRVPERMIREIRGLKFCKVPLCKVSE